MGDYLVHYGIKGQSWGRRRFQNLDGSLTPAGERRYNYEQGETGSERRHGGTSGSFNNSRYRYESRNRANAANARVFPQVNQQVRDNARANAQARASNYGTQSRFGSRNQQAMNAMRSQNRNAPGSDGANSYHMMSPDERDRLGQQRVAERSRARRQAIANNQKAQEDGRNLTNKINQQRQDALDKGNANIANARSQEGYRRLRDAAGQNEAIATSRRNRAVRADQERGKARTEEQNRRNAIERWVSQKWDVVKEESTSNNNVHLNKRGGLPRVGASAFVRDLASAPQLAKGQQMVEKFLGIFKKSKSSGSR